MPRRGNPGFDEDVARFVLSDLKTVWTLELLLLVRGAPQRAWTESGLTGELRANQTMVEEILKRLAAAGLIARQPDGWLYQPASRELDDLCARTQEAYRQKPFAMISLIGRGETALHDPADAFRFKDKEP